MRNELPPRYNDLIHYGTIKGGKNGSENPPSGVRTFKWIILIFDFSYIFLSSMPFYYHSRRGDKQKPFVRNQNRPCLSWSRSRTVWYINSRIQTALTQSIKKKQYSMPISWLWSTTRGHSRILITQSSATHVSLSPFRSLGKFSLYPNPEIFRIFV